MLTRLYQRFRRDEDGAALILTALALPVLVALAALAVGGTTLWATHDDLQRAADLGALAGAANTPTIDASQAARYYPQAIDGLTGDFSLNAALDSSDWVQRPCDVANRNLVTTPRSPMLNAFGNYDSKTGCSYGWSAESPFFDTTSACAANVLDVPNCGTKLQSALGLRLPAVTDPTMSAVNADVSQVASLYGDPASTVLTPAVTSALGNACTATTNLPIVGPVCSQTMSQLLGTLGANAPMPPPLGLDLKGLLPAITTPRLTVTIHDVTVHPTWSPWSFNATATATARRTIKSAIVLPSVGVSGMSAAAFSALPADQRTQLTSMYGTAASTVLSATGVNATVIDPNEVTRLAQSQVTTATSNVLKAVNDATKQAVTALQGAMATAGCTSAPISQFCPEITGPDLTSAQKAFAQDLIDATTPPPSGSAPDIGTQLANAAVTGAPVWIASPTTLVNLESIYGQTVWSVLTNPAVNPVLAPLLKPLMYVPALDVVPATVGKIVVQDPTTGVNKTYYSLTRVAPNLLATKGLYQARLVK